MTQPAEQPSITCPRCGARSYNPNDIREGYCGRCHDWTANDPPWETPGPATPGHRAHFLRRVCTGIADGFDISETTIPDSMSRAVVLNLYPRFLPDEHGLHAVMSADQAESLGRALLRDAARARS